MKRSTELVIGFIGAFFVLCILLICNYKTANNIHECRWCNKTDFSQNMVEIPRNVMYGKKNMRGVVYAHKECSSLMECPFCLGDGWANKDEVKEIEPKE